jgi:hypothetical protein
MADGGKVKATTILLFSPMFDLELFLLFDLPKDGVEECAAMAAIVRGMGGSTRVTSTRKTTPVYFLLLKFISISGPCCQSAKRQADLSPCCAGL